MRTNLVVPEGVGISICSYICIYTYTCVFIKRTYIHTCIHACMHACAYIHVHTYLHMYMFLHTSMVGAFVPEDALQLLGPSSEKSAPAMLGAGLAAGPGG